jgi:hypothetical protein
MKLEIYNKKNIRKFTNTWKADNVLWNNQCVEKRNFKGNIKKSLETIKTHIWHTNTYRLW